MLPLKLLLLRFKIVKLVMLLSSLGMVPDRPGLFVNVSSRRLVRFPMAGGKVPTIDAFDKLKEMTTTVMLLKGSLGVCKHSEHNTPFQN